MSAHGKKARVNEESSEGAGAMRKSMGVPRTGSGEGVQGKKAVQRGE